MNLPVFRFCWLFLLFLLLLFLRSRLCQADDVALMRAVMLPLMEYFPKSTTT